MPLDETVPSAWRRNEKIPVDYQNKILEPQFASLSAYLQACILPNEHHASMFFTAAHVRYLGSVVCVVARFSKLRALLP